MRMLSQSYRCPHCQKAKVTAYDRECPSCKADLTLLSDVALLPYSLYNQALDCLDRGELETAFRKAAAATELAKDFTEANDLLSDLMGKMNNKKSSSFRRSASTKPKAKQRKRKEKKR